MHIDLTNDYSDDTDLGLASVDISTSAGAIEAMSSIGAVIDRINKTQVILGAKKSQLLFTIERFSAVLIKRQIATGRIFDADAAGKASHLVKQQIVSGAAIQMRSAASAQKRSLVDMLF